MTRDRQRDPYTRAGRRGGTPRRPAVGHDDAEGSRSRASRLPRGLRLARRTLTPPEPSLRLGALAHEAHVRLVRRPDVLAAVSAELLGVADLGPVLVLGVGILPNGGETTWPMLDRHGDVVGIRVRDHRSGRKWAVSGSRHGVVWVPGVLRDPVIVTEGPTDSAAALKLGYSAVGRASALPGRVADAELAAVVTGHDVVVVRDRDAAGMAGARAAVEAVLRVARSVRVVVPRRYRDLRAAVVAGLTRAQLDALITTAPPIGPRAVRVVR